jgi:hypothetical protein
MDDLSISYDLSSEKERIKGSVLFFSFFGAYAYVSIFLRDIGGWE